MTDGERRLWAELKRFRGWYGIHVRRQVPIGNYTADFAIHEHRLIIEVDGEHHFTEQGVVRDAQRDQWLASVGYKVLHLNTGELATSFDGCVEEIQRALGVFEKDKAPPPLTPPLKGEGVASAGSRSTAPASGADAAGSPSPLRGGVRGGGSAAQAEPARRA